MLKGGMGGQRRRAIGEGFVEPLAYQVADSPDALLGVQAGEWTPDGRVGRLGVIEVKGLAVVGKGGGEQSGDGVPVVRVPAQEFVPTQRVQEPLAGPVVVTKQDRHQVRSVAGPTRLAHSPQVVVCPYLSLKAGVDLADVVESGEHAKARHSPLVQIIAPGGAGQPLSDGRLCQQRLEARAYVGQVVLQQVDSLRVAVPRLRFGPESPGVVRCPLTVRHVCAPLREF